MVTSNALANAGGGDEPRPALLEVTLNGERRPEPVLFLRAPDGALYVAAATLEQWRMRLPTGAPLRFEGELYYRLTTIPSVRVSFVEEEQSVAIDLPATAFEVQRTNLNAGDEMPMTPSSTGAFLDYDMLVEHSSGDTFASGFFELGLFTRHGVGETSFIASAGSGDPRLVRLESRWEIDRPANATSIRIGDSITAPGPGSVPIRFGGVHYYRNYSVRPGFITMPLPAATGDAAVPSVVDVYVNNVLQDSRPVDPGPFELANLPVQSGGGIVQVVVRDLLGRQVVTEQSYYASSQLLRRGLHDFSYEAGFIRRDFGRRSNGYGEFMASTVHRYGFSDRVTGEAQLQASEHRQMAGVAFNLAAFDLGQLSAWASASHSDAGMGYRFGAAFERRRLGLSFGALAEYASADFGYVGMADDFRPPRATVQAYADLQAGHGSVGVNFLYRSLREAANETLAGLIGTFQVTDSAMVQLYARRSVAGAGQTVVGAHLSLALGGRRSAYAMVEHGGNGFSGEVSLQQSPPVGIGGGFRATASAGAIDRVEAAYVRNLPMATLSGEVSHIEGDTGVRLTATGGIGLIGGDAFASRSLGESFASVKVEGYPGIRVYADNQLIGTTGSDGGITIPSLRPFEANVIRIDEADLPMDAMIDSTEIAVRPFARSGVSVRFAPRRERGVLLQVRLEDGSFLPAGTLIRVEGREETFVAASGGEIYVPDLVGTATLRAAWGDESCEFAAIVPDDDDPQPRLAGLTCRRETRLAAR